MSTRVGRYLFCGPYASVRSLKEQPGVYVIICRSQLLDVGEAANVRERVDQPDRQARWRRSCRGPLTYAVYYIPSLPKRTAIEQALRRQYKILYGQR